MEFDVVLCMKFKFVSCMEFEFVSRLSVSCLVPDFSLSSVTL